MVLTMDTLDALKVLLSLSPDITLTVRVIDVFLFIVIAEKILVLVTKIRQIK